MNDEKNDMYTTPSSELLKENEVESTMASRWSRLWASLLDTLTILIVTMPAMYFTGGFDGISSGQQPSLLYSLALGVVGLIVFLLINIKLLLKSGQTIGKKLLQIKIVDMDGNLPIGRDHLLKRYAFYFLPGQIPVAGPYIGIVNVLFIFGKNRRCLHDLVAKTQVVKVDTGENTKEAF